MQQVTSHPFPWFIAMVKGSKLHSYVAFLALGSQRWSKGQNCVQVTTYVAFLTLFTTRCTLFSNPEGGEFKQAKLSCSNSRLQFSLFEDRVELSTKVWMLRLFSPAMPSFLNCTLTTRLHMTVAHIVKQIHYQWLTQHPTRNFFGAVRLVCLEGK